MADKKPGISTPVRQEDLWTEVRYNAVRPKTWQGQETKKNGLTVYGVQVLVIFKPEERTYDKSGDFYTVSIPMTEEDFTKLSNEKDGTLVQFSNLRQHYYNEKTSYTASGISPARPSNTIQVPKQ
jgi:hypothetical protein